MNYRVVRIMGPYNGPFSENIITYILEAADGKIALWHEGPNKKLDAKVSDVLKGIVLTEKNGIDYKKSNPIKVISQLDLWENSISI